MDTFRFYTREDTPVDTIRQIVNSLENIRDSHQCNFEVLAIEDLGDDEREELIESIRVISRKNAIGVVSKGRGSLPISRKKNLSNVGILIHSRDGKDISVHPNVKNNKLTTASQYLNLILTSSSLEEALDSNHISEDDISRMITSLPELIETGLTFKEIEVEVDGGRIDAVFIDEQGKHFLIEIEINARDNAIGQVQRFKLPYSEKYGVDPEDIRLGIVCASIDNSRMTACRGAGIEVYCLCLKNMK
ncbi:endonuclease NucS domain-containing protein [Methanococcoides sp. FTZ1]|uniref:endonuclease NucS domain-containing protein n=1 Tax=Methanococcoides sp. FTZ1 TaxID=3439061 RepID=UPI003F83E46B